ncbi:hypothetical protein [Paraburkholderia bonniea]|uniref:hypothetical protein n=1 Tax=Paraburkholderia bonniea TaxID=2152891 RepID=UPI00129221B3|nr:hypothetical protein [Paraburkholderia bonniea]
MQRMVLAHQKEFRRTRIDKHAGREGLIWLDESGCLGFSSGYLTGAIGEHVRFALNERHRQLAALRQ